MRRKKRHRGNVKIIFPSTITSFSMVLGFIAILFACEDRVVTSCYLLILAALLDGLDGKVARMTNTASEFGIQYDSLADLVSFGIAPAVIYYRYFIFSEKTDKVYLLLPILFFLCGAIRLARFNVTASVYGKAGFTGMPIPAAANTLVALPPLTEWIAKSGFLSKISLPQWFTRDNITDFSIVLIILLSISMISQIRFGMPAQFLLRRYKPKWINYLLIATLLAVLFLAHFIVFWSLLCLYYLAATYADALVERLKRQNGGDQDPDDAEVADPSTTS